jgi:hypothetical protein
MSFSRISTLALALAAGLAAPASAATYNIAFTQNGVGDAGPDFFGTFDIASGTGFANDVTRFDVTINGIRFDDLGLGMVFFNGTTTQGNTALSGFAADEVFFNTDPPIPDFSRISNILFLAGLGDDPGTVSVVRNWGFGVNCSAEVCTGPVLGTYTLEQVPDAEPPVIPLPATAALLPLGLVALAAIRRRKDKE